MTRLAWFVVALVAALTATDPARAGREEGLRAYKQGDYAGALRELRPVAEQGDTTAQYFLGLIYKDGRGVNADPAEAARWFRRAAELGDGRAAFSLARFHFIGSGVAKNVTEAVRLLELAHDLGRVEGAIILARLYRSGEFVPKDMGKAARWYAEAAVRGSIEGQLHLGGLFAAGEGVAKSFASANKWFERAANQGNDIAQLRLSTAYEFGLGVPIDRAIAYKWALLAQRNAKSPQAADEAKGTIKMLRDSASRAEIASGDAMARAWQAKLEESPEPDADGPLKAAGFGTGFVISDRGHVLTNAHVVPACREVRVAQPAQGSVRVAVLARDAVNDLALLKLDGPVSAVAAFRDGRGVRPGDNVLAVGFPLAGLLSSDIKVTSGSVNALAGLEDDSRFLQLSAPVQPGNSGGPLVDLAGNVVGVVTLKLNALAVARQTGGDLAQNINYALKVSVARNFLDAHDVPYRMAASVRELPPADAADKARDFTVQVLCYR